MHRPADTVPTRGGGNKFQNAARNSIHRPADTVPTRERVGTNFKTPRTNRSSVVRAHPGPPPRVVQPPPRVVQPSPRAVPIHAAAPCRPNHIASPAPTLIEILWRPRGTLRGCWPEWQSVRRFSPSGLRVSLVPTVVLRRLRRRGGPLMARPGRRQVLPPRQATLVQVEGVAARVHWTVARSSLPPRSMRRLRRRSPFGTRACRALTATTRRLRRCTRRTASCLSLDKTALRATPTAARPLALAA